MGNSQQKKIYNSVQDTNRYIKVHIPQIESNVASLQSNFEDNKKRVSDLESNVYSINEKLENLTCIVTDYGNAYNKNIQPIINEFNQKKCALPSNEINAFSDYFDYGEQTKSSPPS
jgi:predicted  nucleic acid-binding Zn-ribbon protein